MGTKTYFPDGISSQGAFELTSSGKFWYTIKIEPDAERVRQYTVPTQVILGAHKAYSLPIYQADNEELYYSIRVPNRWDGTTAPIIIFGGWIVTAQDPTKNFKLQASWNNFSIGDVVSDALTDIETQTATGVAAQYKTFVSMHTVADASGITSGDNLAIRLRRIAASADEMEEEFAVQGAAVRFLCDKLGAAS